MRNRTVIPVNIKEKLPPAPCISPSRIRRLLDLQCGTIWKDLTLIFNARKNKSGILLDVGCGAQPYRTMIPPNIKYVGIDWEQSRDAFGYHTVDTIYYSGDLWPVSSENFDFILSTETLEHVYDTRNFIDQAWRCLKTNGELFLTVPFSARWHFIPHDYWRFTPSALRQLLEEKGFKDIKIYARGNEYTVAAYKLICLFLPLFFSLGNWREISKTSFILRFITSSLLAPIFVLLVLLGNMSLYGKEGNDCLGYTVIAIK